MQPTNTHGEYLVEAGRLAPPAAVTGVSVMGVTLEEWAYIVTILYTLLMITGWVLKFIKERKDSRQ